MYKLALYMVFIVGIAIHIFFMQLNQTLTVPDSFAYLQMAHHLGNFSVQGFGTGWFGFLYSMPIAFVNVLLNILPITYDDSLFLSAQIVNILLFLLSAIFAYMLGSKYLDGKYNIFFLILFFLSSTLLHYNINILSENLFLPLFLGFVLVLDRFIQELSLKTKHVHVHGKYIELNNKYDIFWFTLLLSFIAALLYFTRSESFIYIGSIFIILFVQLISGHINIPRFFSVSLIFVISFAIFISPYIFYLNGITGEWGLTNKGASNIRQAELRGIEQMDDAGFEQAVGELTDDKHSLIGGFAGGLKYEKPTYEKPLLEYFQENTSEVLSRFYENQKKLYFSTLPSIILGNAIHTYNDISFIFYKSKIFLFVLIIPTLLFLYGCYKLVTDKLVTLTEKKNLMLISLALFIVASVFFTFFFVLDRYFLVFVPLGLLIVVYGIQELFVGEYLQYHTYASVLKYVLFLSILVFTFVLGDWNYFTYNSYNDERYKMKKEMGLWLKDNYKDSEGMLLDTTELNIMERFPITTYYTGTKNRWIVPYTDKVEDVIEYAKYNKIDYLLVDTFDFTKYRPELSYLVDTKKQFEGLERIHFFEVPGKKVILYKIK